MGIARMAILALAAVAAVLAALLVQGVISTDKKVAAPAAKPDVLVAEVLVAASDLQIGHVVGDGDLKWLPWPESAVSGSYVTKQGSEGAKGSYIGGTVRQPMLAGEPVTSNKIVTSGNAGFMAALLSPGARAVSVKISAETGAGGFILPNDRVDVMLTTSGGNRNEQFTRTVLSNVRVLAIDQSFREEGDNRVVVGKTATLELSPAQGEVLAQSEASGSVSLALRSLADAKADEGDESAAVNRAVTLMRYGAVSHVVGGGAAQ